MSPTLQHLIEATEAQPVAAVPRSLLDEIVAATEAQPVAPKPKAKPKPSGITREYLDMLRKGDDVRVLARHGDFGGTVPRRTAEQIRQENERARTMGGPGWWEESNAAPRATMQVFTDPRTGVRYPTRAHYIKATQSRPVCPVCGRPDCPGATDPTYR